MYSRIFALTLLALPAAGFSLQGCSGDEFETAPGQPGGSSGAGGEPGSAGAGAGGAGAGGAGAAGAGAGSGGASAGQSAGGAGQGGESGAGAGGGGGGSVAGVGGTAAGSGGGDAGQSGAAGAPGGAGGQGGAGQAGAGGGPGAGGAGGAGGSDAGSAGAGGVTDCLPPNHVCPGSLDCVPDSDDSCGLMCTKCEKNSSCQGGLCKPKPPLSCPDGFAEYGGKCREFGGWFVEDGDTPNCNELSGDGCQCPDGFVQKSLSPLSEGSKTLSFCVPDGAPSGAWGGAYVKTSTNPAAQCFGVNNPLSNTCGCPAGWDVYPEIVLGTPDATRVLYMCLQPGAPGATVVGGYARFDDTTKKHSTNAGKNGCFFDSMDDYKCVCPPGSKAVSVPALAPVQTQDDEPPNSAPARVAICVKE